MRTSRILLGTLLPAALGAGLLLLPPTRRVAAAPSPEPAPFRQEFTHDVPESIARRDFPYVRAVEEAARLRWFDDEEAWRLAQQAWEKTQAHAKLVEAPLESSSFRAVEAALADVRRDKRLAGYEIEVTFATPYLLCFVSKERMADEDLITLPATERRAKRVEMESRRIERRRRVTEIATVLQQTYAEFMSRYGEANGLVDLMRPFGGRPELPVSKRSYRDGLPLTVLILDDGVVLDEQSVFVSFDPRTGWVYFHPESSSREYDVNRCVHESTHQLVHWFTRQKSEWAPVRRPPSFFTWGFADYMGAVTMSKDRKLTFHGVNRPRLELLKGARRQLEDAGKSLYRFPVKDLVALESYHSVRAWSARTWGIDGGGFYFAQSYALVRFLHETPAYRASLMKFLAAMLAVPGGASEGYVSAKFAEALGLSSDEDWRRLDGEFADYYAKLIDMDTTKIAEPPPARDDWPGYMPLEPIDPRTWR